MDCQQHVSTATEKHSTDALPCVKATFENAIVRFQLSALSYDSLLGKLKDKFPTFTGRVHYVDVEGDFVVISSDEELRHALDICKNAPVLRIVCSNWYPYYFFALVDPYCSSVGDAYMSRWIHRHFPQETAQLQPLVLSLVTQGFSKKEIKQNQDIITTCEGDVAKVLKTYFSGTNFLRFLKASEALNQRRNSRARKCRKCGANQDSSSTSSTSDEIPAEHCHCHGKARQGPHHHRHAHRSGSAESYAHVSREISSGNGRGVELTERKHRKKTSEEIQAWKESKIRRMEERKKMIEERQKLTSQEKNKEREEKWLLRKKKAAEKRRHKEKEHGIEDHFDNEKREEKLRHREENLRRKQERLKLKEEKMKIKEERHKASVSEGNGPKSSEKREEFLRKREERLKRKQEKIKAKESKLKSQMERSERKPVQQTLPAESDSTNSGPSSEPNEHSSTSSTSSILSEEFSHRHNKDRRRNFIDAPTVHHKEKRQHRHRPEKSDDFSISETGVSETGVSETSVSNFFPDETSEISNEKSSEASDRSERMNRRKERKPKEKKEKIGKEDREAIRKERREIKERERQERNEKKEGEKRERRGDGQTHSRASEFLQMAKSAYPETPVIEKLVSEKKIQKLFLDGNNMLFITDKLRKCTLTGNRIQAEKSTYRDSQPSFCSFV